MDVKSVGIIGAGAWGTALGCALARGGHNVELWALEEDVTESINSEHENKRYLPGFSLYPTMKASCDIKKVALDKDFIILASPSLYLASTIKQFVDVDVLLCITSIKPYRTLNPNIDVIDCYLVITNC